MNSWNCAVPVATVWTSPESAREIDKAATENPVRLTKWLEQLPYELVLNFVTVIECRRSCCTVNRSLSRRSKATGRRSLLFGNRRKKDERGYPGWVPLVQLKEAKPIQAQGFAKVTAGKSAALAYRWYHLLSLSHSTRSCRIVVSRRLRTCTYAGWRSTVVEQGCRVLPSIHQFDKASCPRAVDKGLHFLDLPYLWGGMSSYGYDCSGFTYNMLKACGYAIPRDAGDQAQWRGSSFG